MSYSKMTYTQKLVNQFISKRHSLNIPMTQIFDYQNWCSRYVYRTEDGKLTLKRTPFVFKYSNLIFGKHEGVSV
jgi:hypothetical protein